MSENCPKCPIGTCWTEDRKGGLRVFVCENPKCGAVFECEEDWDYEGEDWHDGSTMGKEILDGTVHSTPTQKAIHPEGQA